MFTLNIITAVKYTKRTDTVEKKRKKEIPKEYVTRPPKPGENGQEDEKKGRKRRQLKKTMGCFGKRREKGR